MKVNSIRVRANTAIIEDGKILLFPHFLDNGNTIWYLPGGKVDFLEKIEEAAVRECKEETGLEIDIIELLDVSENIETEKPWHSISISYLARIVGGDLIPEMHDKFGKKEAKWFTQKELKALTFRPESAVKKAFKMN